MVNVLETSSRWCWEECEKERMFVRRVDAAAPLRHATPRHAAVIRSKANEVSSSTSRTIRRWVFVAATRFANYPKQLKASYKKIRRRYLGRSENNSDTHPPASSRPPLALGWMKRILVSCRHRVVLLRSTFPFVSSPRAPFFSSPPTLPASSFAAINLRGRYFGARLDSS